MQLRKSIFSFVSIGTLTAFLLAMTSMTAVAQNSDIAIKVNGEQITKAEIDEQIDRTFERMKKKYGQQMENEQTRQMMRQRIRKQVIDQRVEQLILKTHAKRSDISISKKEEQDYIKAKKNQFQNKEQFQRKLKTEGITKEEFRQRNRDELAVKKFLNKKIGKVSVSDDEARQYFKENQKRFRKSSFEKSKRKIKRLLERRKQQEKRQQLVQKLRKKSEVDIRI